MKLAKSFGQALKQAREAANLSQEELAEAAGLDRTFISLLERGLRQPSLKTVFDLSPPLKQTPCEIVEAVERAMKRNGNGKPAKNSNGKLKS